MSRDYTGIAYTEDIIARVASELGITEREVSKVYYAIVDYIDMIANDSKFITLKLPRFGYFYLRERPTLRELRRLEFKRRTKGVDEEELKKINVLLKKYKVFQEFKKTLFAGKLNKEFSYHYRKPLRENTMYTAGMTMEEIEDFQKELARR